MNNALVAVLWNKFPNLQGAIDVDIVALAERFGYIGNSTVENEVLPRARQNTQRQYSYCWRGQLSQGR